MHYRWTGHCWAKLSDHSEAVCLAARLLQQHDSSSAAGGLALLAMLPAQHDYIRNTHRDADRYIIPHTICT